MISDQADLLYFLNCFSMAEPTEDIISIRLSSVSSESLMDRLRPNGMAPGYPPKPAIGLLNNMNRSGIMMRAPRPHKMIIGKNDSMGIVPSEVP